MDEILQALNRIDLDWITTLIAALFGFTALSEAIDRLWKKLGIETKTEKRFKALETQQHDLIEENKELEKKIKEAEKRCNNAIIETETKFDNREREHWGESQNIRNDYDTKMSSLDSKLDVIIEKLDKKDELDFKKLRNSIVQAGEDAIDKGFISIRKLRSLEELFSEYQDTYNGNTYVETLMVKVRNLKVVGKLNEHGEDIE